ncbi:MAG: sigma-70 family RNA polymerase sigma factor [Planctomycetes bacterium]|nr:sigma-70 family RNA polymerase sigma factor [Planctomycetota bacterium]
MSEVQPEIRLLVARARLGDAKAFQTLVHEYTPRLLWFVRKLGLSDNDADDVLQESWLVAWSKLNRLRSLRLFRSWLYGITRNKAMQHLAKDEAREVPVADIDPLDEPPEESFFERYQPYLNQALERMSLTHREILALRFIEGMTYEELAQTTGTTLGTIKSRLHNAKHFLRRQLEVLTND